MQALAEEKATASYAPDRLRIKRLVEAAAEKTGGFKQLADYLEVHAQLVSNWRNGVKTPSPEAQADLAQIAGENALVAGLMALIEKADGNRKARLQAAYREWTVRAAANLENVRSLYFPTYSTARRSGFFYA